MSPIFIHIPTHFSLFLSQNYLPFIIVQYFHVLMSDLLFPVHASIKTGAKLRKEGIYNGIIEKLTEHTTYQNW